MPIGKRNILLKILTLMISLTLIGFQKVPNSVDPGLVEANGSWSPGYVELLVYGQAGSGSGMSFANFTWDPVTVFLPITGFDSRGNGVFRGGAFTSARGNYRQGPIVGIAGWPAHWKIYGHITPPPDCALKITIDETWFHGSNVACEPTGIVGCIHEAWPADFFPGVEFTIPFDRAWGSSVPSIGTMGIPIHLTVIVNELHFGDSEGYVGGKGPLGCDYHLFFPVIPQAP